MRADDKRNSRFIDVEKVVRNEPSQMATIGLNGRRNGLEAFRGNSLKLHDEFLRALVILGNGSRDPRRCYSLLRYHRVDVDGP